VSSNLGVPLERILPAFEGVLPSGIATCSADGIPNVTYLSIVQYVDSERVALSNQFLNKTRANLAGNPFAAVRIVDPTTALEYELELSHLHTETSGDVFDAMRARLEALASQSGMEAVFRLRGVDVFRVERCDHVPGSIGVSSAPSASPDPLVAIDAYVRRLAECRDLAEVTSVGLEALEDLFGFGSSILFLTDPGDGPLFVVASNGYVSSGVGAEVALGHGVVGVAAERQRPIAVPNLARERSMAMAIEHREGPAANEIPLPGLIDAQSVAAVPLLLRGRLLGVLYLDDRSPARFGAPEERLLAILAGHLAVHLALLESGGVNPAAAPLEVANAPTEQAAKATFYAVDGSVFIDGQYVIKGVPGRILAKMLSEYSVHGRRTFSNKELRLDRSLELPVGNDNLEARLLVLRKRLAEHENGVRLDRVGRGQLELRVTGSISITRVDAAPS
jgi:adenylate cyclase